MFSGSDAVSLLNSGDASESYHVKIRFNSNRLLARALFNTLTPEDRYKKRFITKLHLIDRSSALTGGAFRLAAGFLDQFQGLTGGEDGDVGDVG